MGRARRWGYSARVSFSRIGSALLVVGGFALVIAGAGCGGAPPAEGPVMFVATPFMTLPSDSGTLTVTVWSSPQPPDKGVDALKLAITDQTGADVTGLQLAVVPWMPAHGHGTSITPTVSAQPDGTYRVDDVYFFMSGTWQLRTSISGGGGLADSVTPNVDIP